MLKLSEETAMFCGIPPNCDRCCEMGEAKLRITVEHYGTLQLCDGCLKHLLELGLEKEDEDDGTHLCRNV